MKHFAPEIVEKKIANMGAMGMLGVDVEGKTVETGDGLRGVGARLFERYLEWTDSQGYKSLTRSGFYKELKRRDGIRYIEKTTVDGRTSRNVFAGIRPNDAIHQR